MKQPFSIYSSFLHTLLKIVNEKYKIRWQLISIVSFSIEITFNWTIFSSNVYISTGYFGCSNFNTFIFSVRINSSENLSLEFWSGSLGWPNFRDLSWSGSRLIESAMVEQIFRCRMHWAEIQSSLFYSSACLDSYRDYFFKKPSHFRRSSANHHNILYFSDRSGSHRRYLSQNVFLEIHG